jgi:hypothetical protein
MHVSYLVRAPDTSYALWPQVALLHPLLPEREYILANQPKSLTHYVVRKILREDREKMKALANAMEDTFIETKEMLEIPAWRTRFWFAIQNREEYIKTIDRWEA